MSNAARQKYQDVLHQLRGFEVQPDLLIVQDNDHCPFSTFAKMYMQFRAFLHDFFCRGFPKQFFRCADPSPSCHVTQDGNVFTHSGCTEWNKTRLSYSCWFPMIDCTHVELYHTHSLNVQGVCDSKCVIRNVTNVSVYPGSVYNSFILRTEFFFLSCEMVGF